MLEPIQAEGGVYVADREYLKQLRELCLEKDMLLIFDEIQTGMGRTGTFFAYEQFGVQPDIMTLAKGFGGGVPIGACLATDSVAEAFSPGSSCLDVRRQSAWPVPPAWPSAGCLLEGKVLDQARRMGEYLAKGLADCKDATSNGARMCVALGSCRGWSWRWTREPLWPMFGPRHADQWRRRACAAVCAALDHHPARNRSLLDTSADCSANARRRKRFTPLNGRNQG